MYVEHLEHCPAQNKDDVRVFIIILASIQGTKNLYNSASKCTKHAHPVNIIILLRPGLPGHLGGTVG